MLMTDLSQGPSTAASPASFRTDYNQLFTADIASSQNVFAFRNFEVWPSARLLVKSGEAVCIGGRAFDLLVVLLQSRGSVVPKSRILQEVWPSTIVDESNLRFQIATLRNVLGKDRDLIRSVPGRGYFFAFDRSSLEQPELDRTKKEPVEPVEFHLRQEEYLNFAGSAHSHVSDQFPEWQPRDERITELFRRFLQTLVAAYGSLEAAGEAFAEPRDAGTGQLAKSTAAYRS